MESITEADHPDSCVRILEVIGNASKGGMENYIKNFLAHLPATRFRVTCICPYESLFTAALRQLKVEGVYITPIADDPPWRSIQLTMEVARLHQIDVLHAHMPKAHILAGLAGCLIQKPVVATIHGMDITSHELGVARAVGSTLITNCQQAYAEALAMGILASRRHEQLRKKKLSEWSYWVYTKPPSGFTVRTESKPDPGKCIKRIKGNNYLRFYPALAAEASNQVLPFTS